MGTLEAAVATQATACPAMSTEEDVIDLFEKCGRIEMICMKASSSSVVQRTRGDSPLMLMERHMLLRGESIAQRTLRPCEVL
eukprot:5599135-Amphidinium_carterae.1